MTSVYVAGASCEWRRARRVMERLRAAGHDITEDWTVPVEAVGVANAIPEGPAREAARDCTCGVQEASVVIVLAPKDGRTSIGCWVEMGIAIETGKIVLYVGDPLATVFARIDDVRVFDDENAALAWMEERCSQDLL